MTGTISLNHRLLQVFKREICSLLYPSSTTACSANLKQAMYKIISRCNSGPAPKLLGPRGLWQGHKLGGECPADIALSTILIRLQLTSRGNLW